MKRYNYGDRFRLLSFALVDFITRSVTATFGLPPRRPTLYRPIANGYSAGQVSNVVEAMLAQNSDGHVSSNPHAAADHGFLLRIEFLQTVAKIINGNVDGVIAARQRVPGDFRWRANIDELNVGQVGVGVDEFVNLVQLIASRKGGLMDGVFGGTERWSVS